MYIFNIDSRQADTAWDQSVPAGLEVRKQIYCYYIRGITTYKNKLYSCWLGSGKVL